MDAIILDQPERLRLTTRDAPPAPPPPGHARVRVRRVGICGTDWHAYRGKQPFFTCPRVLGHELGVEVLEVNDPASPLRAGDRCAVEPYLNCGQCIACRQDKGNACANLQVLGVHRDGGMQEFLIVPANKLHRSHELTLDQLALVETLAIGCHAVARGQLRAGEHVLVIGAGPIGLSVLPFVQAGGGKLIVADVAESRLKFCQQWGVVEHVIDARGDMLPALQGLTNNQLPTLIIDATGNPASMANAFNFVAPGGRLVFVGLFQGDLTFNDPNFHRREMTVLASRNALPEDFRHIIGLIEHKRIDTDAWITHRAGHRGLIDIFPRWLAPDANVLKAMVSFDE
jgi:2-desacetyl-2-hydroxyethyl bacteriochlorophyllide A dehydrogenase